MKEWFTLAPAQMLKLAPYLFIYCKNRHIKSNVIDDDEWDSQILDPTVVKKKIKKSFFFFFFHFPRNKT